MTQRKKLEQIVELETPHAEEGCEASQALVINALAELEALDRFEWRLRASEFDNQDHAWRSEERNWGVESEDA